MGNGIYDHFYKVDSKEDEVEKQRVMLEVEEQSKIILYNEHNKNLFVNFFDLYAKDEFNDISFLMACERQMLISMYGQYFVEFERRNDDGLFPHNFCVRIYSPFVQLLVKNGVLQSADADNRYDKYCNFLIITVCLKNISREYFANSFKELYGGFFPNIES